MGAELGACNLVAESANRCHYKRKPQAKQANAEGEAKANTACEEGLFRRVDKCEWVSESVSVSVYILCVFVCLCVSVCACDMAAYSHFKMASIFLSQQNGDCKIVVHVVVLTLLAQRHFVA